MSDAESEPDREYDPLLTRRELAGLVLALSVGLLIDPFSVAVVVLGALAVLVLFVGVFIWFTSVGAVYDACVWIIRGGNL